MIVVYNFIFSYMQIFAMCVFIGICIDGTADAKYVTNQ